MRKLGFAAFLGVLSLSATADATTFYGYTATPNGVVSGAAKTAHDSFIAALSTSSVEDIESFAVNQALPLALSFEGSAGTVAATLSGSGQVRQAFNGLFPTSPSRELYATGDLTISFTGGVYAFGFYATDVSDFGSALSVTFNDGTAGSYQVTTTAAKPDGNLLFFGLTSDTAITSVSLKGAKASDGFGYDDLTIGAPAAVPEPATWGMFIGGFGLVGGSLRRRQRTNLRFA
ncbi:PEPxxWA-CTERM sorting domain-containing protein [Sphingomonas sp. BIUV-7]|uniref:PEPxxWA-CTERM sorting domain-containing protein n=1 Tax=Sphingomonas natans TaxID=3063330 RepID=A0ABT8YF77_9SPHN|nr:PEPxxWA-CTERM sorting domain-containing protein [Sphingomonas sp. BIUV-7]MDO6416354.1 PEPxxWA-CTERM sorting domain-containing protein [Sphingomonas sp. BIUV-7]